MIQEMPYGLSTNSARMLHTALRPPSASGLDATGPAATSWAGLVSIDSKEPEHMHGDGAARALSWDVSLCYC
jgi:hypothetical protein